MGGRDIVIGAGGLAVFDGGWGGCSTGADMSVLGLRDIQDTRGVGEGLMGNGRKCRCASDTQRRLRHWPFEALF